MHILRQKIHNEKLLEETEFCKQQETACSKVVTNAIYRFKYSFSSAYFACLNDDKTVLQ